MGEYYPSFNLSKLMGFTTLNVALIYFNYFTDLIYVGPIYFNINMVIPKYKIHIWQVF